MNSKDKTREKLVGSMRKTKAVAGSNNPTAGESDAAKPAKKTSASVSEASSTSRSDKADENGYQSSRRVWPD